MTQVKNTKKVKKVRDMRAEFLKLSKHDQDACTNFFNMHNGAHFIYHECMSKECQEYVSYCIRMSQEADKINNNPEKHANEEVIQK